MESWRRTPLPHPTLFLLLTLLIGSSVCNTIYLGLENAVDNSTCGIKEQTPCQTINYILKNRVVEGDTIYVLPGEYSITPFVIRIPNLTITAGDEETIWNGGIEKTEIIIIEELPITISKLKIKGGYNWFSLIPNSVGQISITNLTFTDIVTGKQFFYLESEHIPNNIANIGGIIVENCLVDYFIASNNYPVNLNSVTVENSQISYFIYYLFSTEDMSSLQLKVANVEASNSNFTTFYTELASNNFINFQSTSITYLYFTQCYFYQLIEFNGGTSSMILSNYKMKDIRFFKDFIGINNTQSLHITGVDINNATCYYALDCYLVQLKSCVSVSIQSLNFTNTNLISFLDYYFSAPFSQKSFINLELMSFSNIEVYRSPIVRILLPANFDISVNIDGFYINNCSATGFIYFSTYSLCSIMMNDIKVSNNSYSEYQPAFYFFGCSELTLSNSTFTSLTSDNLGSLFLFTQKAELKGITIDTIESFNTAILTNNNITLEDVNYIQSGKIPFILCDYQSNSIVDFSGGGNRICGELTVFESFCSFENNDLIYDDYYDMQFNLCPDSSYEDGDDDDDQNQSINLMIIVILIISSVVFIIIVLLIVYLIVFCYRRSKKVKPRYLSVNTHPDELEEDDQFYQSYDFDNQ